MQRPRSGAPAVSLAHRLSSTSIKVEDRDRGRDTLALSSTSTKVGDRDRGKDL